jgi:hypothetical protein
MNLTAMLSNNAMLQYSFFITLHSDLSLLCQMKNNVILEGMCVIINSLNTTNMSNFGECATNRPGNLYHSVKVKISTLFLGIIRKHKYNAY